MKKFTLIVFMAMVAMTTHAASISWKIQSSAQVKFNNASVGANATAYLVYLGSDALSDLSFDDVIAMTAVASTSTSVGKVNKSVSTTDDAGAGNYALFLTYTSDGDQYYNVSATQNSLSQSAIDGLLNDGTALNSATFTFSNTTNEKGVAGVIGGGWYSPAQTQPVNPDVPEPATGALALAGVALLFKRRRA